MLTVPVTRLDPDTLRRSEIPRDVLEAIIAHGNRQQMADLLRNRHLPDDIQDHLVLHVSLSKVVRWLDLGDGEPRSIQQLFEIPVIWVPVLRHAVEEVLLHRCAAMHQCTVTEIPYYENLDTEKDAAYDIEDWLSIRGKNPDVLRQLAKHRDWDIRVNVVDNPHTPLDVWAAMYKDRSKRVREAVQERSQQTDVTDLLGEDV